MGILSEFILWLPTYFFPKICYGCGREGLFVCPDCRPKVAKALNSLICPNCQKPSPLGLTHPECQKKNGLDGLISYYRYAGWAKEIIKDAKFGLNPHWRAMKELAEEMARCLDDGKWKFLNLKSRILDDLIKNSKNQDCQDQECQEYLPSRNLSGFWIIVPIPLHWFRKMKRGFNQAEIIAKPMAKSLNLPLKTDLIERSVYSLPQTLVGDASRRTNVRKAFCINSKFSISCEAGSCSAGRNSELDNVLLVDDVWTTGATMKECCRTLKLAGVKRVWGITLLRA